MEPTERGRRVGRVGVAGGVVCGGVEGGRGGERGREGCGARGGAGGAVLAGDGEPGRVGGGGEVERAEARAVAGVEVVREMRGERAGVWPARGVSVRMAGALAEERGGILFTYQRLGREGDEWTREEDVGGASGFCAFECNEHEPNNSQYRCSGQQTKGTRIPTSSAWERVGKGTG